MKFSYEIFLFTNDITQGNLFLSSYRLLFLNQFGCLQLRICPFPFDEWFKRHKLAAYFQKTIAITQYQLFCEPLILFRLMNHDN